MPLLEAIDISRQLPNGLELLSRISLKVEAGERIALLGPTGAGKTLLLRSLALLDPLTSGEIYWQGQRVEDGNIPAYRQQAIYLHQRATVFPGTVEDNLRLPFTFTGTTHGYQSEIIGRLLQLCHLDETFLKKPANRLSGGEAQQMALLRALQLDPKLLLLDEPTASLDGRSTESVENLLLTWLNDKPQQRACLWVSHNAAQAERIATRSITMKKGKQS